jgi:hypothetical protein
MTKYHISKPGPFWVLTGGHVWGTTTHLSHRQAVRSMVMAEQHWHSMSPEVQKKWESRRQDWLLRRHLAGVEPWPTISR